MKLHNTLTRKKEHFTPIDSKTAHIYSCGPTVYATATIGNLRAYIFTDILKKTIELNGFAVYDVMNLTDVGHLQSDSDDGEDKIEVAAKRAQITPAEIAKRYTNEFFADCKKLNIRDPKIIAPATAYIQQMIDHIIGLEEKGFTYKTSDGVYFHSNKFPTYYQLSSKQPTGDRAGERIALGEKQNANDFALWKLTPPTALQSWDSPWGRGCPGWHIECSAIARQHLGDTFDIHTGGIDHIPIHHTNEIAQSEALTGKPFAKFWLHNEFIKIDNAKMAKSLGNVYTLADLENRGFHPMSFRYFVLLAHYKTILNFTFPALTAAQIAYNNLAKELFRHIGPLSTKIFLPLDDYRERFKSYLADDLNTPKAIALVWELVKMAPNRFIYELVLEFDKILSLGLKEAVESEITKSTNQQEVPQQVQALAEQRQLAKANKDWETADKLRDEIRAFGYDVIDTKEGWKLKETDLNF